VGSGVGGTERDLKAPSEEEKTEIPYPSQKKMRSSCAYCWAPASAALESLFTEEEKRTENNRSGHQRVRMMRAQKHRNTMPMGPPATPCSCSESHRWEI